MVRDFAGNAYDMWAELQAGTEVMVTFGPLSNDGLDWYEVVFSTIAGDPDIWGSTGSGWVAAGPSGMEATSLQIGAPRCPEVITADDIGLMSTYARLACLGTASHEVTGVINGCTDYSIPSEEPAWLLSECLNLVREDGTATDLFLYFPPELNAPKVDEGDIVRLVGHVDDARATQCGNLVSAEPPIPESVVDAYSTLSCRGNFVVTELEITGHA